MVTGAGAPRGYPGGSGPSSPLSPVLSTHRFETNLSAARKLALGWLMASWSRRSSMI